MVEGLDTKIVRKHSFSEKSHLLLISLAVLLIHLSVSVFTRIPYVMPDEIGVAAEAALLAGENWNPVTALMPYYGYGQALLYAPIFYISKDPVIRYLLMGCLNSFLLSTIPAFIFYTLECLSFLSGKERLICSLLVGLFPTYLVFTKTIMNETMMCLIPVILLFLIVRLTAGKGNRAVNSILLAFFSVYAYACHGRGIVFPIAVIITLIVARVVCRRSVASIPSFAVAFGVLFFVHTFFMRMFLSNLWPSIENRSNTFDSTLPQVFRILSGELTGDFFRMLIGHIITSVLSSYGLLIVVILFAGFCIFSPSARKKYFAAISGNDCNTCIVSVFFSLLIFCGALVLGVVFLAGRTGDYQIYSRYYANTLGPVFLVALLILLRTTFVQDHFKCVVLGFACMFPAYLPSVQSFLGKPYRVPVIANIFPYLGKKSNTELYFVCAIISVLFLLILIISSDKRRRLLVPLFLLIFLHVHYYCGFLYTVPASGKAFQYFEPVYSTLTGSSSVDQDHSPIYYYNPSGNWASFQLPYMFPERKTYNLDSDGLRNYLATTEDNSLLISEDDLLLEYLSRSFYRVSTEVKLSGESDSVHYIWAYGDVISEKMNASGRIRAENYFGETVQIDMSSFSTMVGERNDNGIITNGKAGHGLFGPYIFLPAQAYRVTVTGELISGQLDETSYFEVICGSDKTQVGIVKDMRNSLDGNQFKAEILFDLPTSQENCEFRIYVNEGAVMEFHSVFLSAVTE